MEKSHKYINIKVDAAFYEDFIEVVPWGLRGHLLAAVVKLVVDAIKEDGLIVTGAILAGEYKISLNLRDTAGNPIRMEGSDAKI